ncbi:PocR ligand-binding domain-containing protein [Pseudodesulfovibrio sp. zrk46]|uniref:PocR ligand-binding domain-containing protein n=1 Tax=Pseudodesulfovibrio sp. zrk46 TaxID=2725288 RepID=UPI0014495D2E|nr:PocR ligand-binding domain-containing protein [Pseudodesulfovibrio sp. zrk46]QJB55484.1 transcriptional regulator [Pseudodesulfovibrio sp. zrk46]
MKMTDLMTVEEWQALEKELHEKFKINAEVVEEDGKRVTGKRLWCNDLCKTIRESDKGVGGICAPSGQEFVRLTREERKPFIEECDICLAKINVPVVVNDELIGAVGGCGPLPEGNELEEFMVSVTMGLEEGEIAQLAESIPTASQERLEEIQAFIENKVAEVLARNS